MNGQSSNHMANNNNAVDDSWNDGDDGWGDDDLDVSEGAGRQAPAALTSQSQFSAANEDDFFASAAMDAKPARPAVMASSKGKKPTGKLSVPGMKTAGTKAPKPAVQKLAVDNVDDGWDDF